MTIRYSEAVEDCVISGERAVAEVEAAYRRGYQQGAYIAVASIREGHPVEAIYRWATETLHRWRYRGQPWRKGRLVKPVRPPEPDEIWPNRGQ